MKFLPIVHANDTGFKTLRSSLVLIAFFLCCYFHGLAQGPNYVWARNAIGYAVNNISEGFTISSDAQDNLYITGYYAGTTSFGTTTLTGGMPYLAKYDPSGNALWAKDGTGYAINRALSAAPDGHVFVAGTFLNANTATFGSYTLICTGQQDLYAVEYDSFGNLKWALNTRGTASSMQVAPSIAADASGNAYLMGDFNATTLNIGTASVTAIGGEQVFLAKIDSSGNVLWARNSTGGVLQNALAGKCVATDNAGNIYVLGKMRGTSINFGSITATGVTGTNIFLVKYDSSGNPLWAKAASASNINAIATDPYDNSVYISGAYSNSANFDAITLTNAGANTFLAKYDTAGNAIWAKSINGPNTTYCIAPNMGKVYISGKFTSLTSPPITFDTITITQPAGSTDPMWFSGYYSTGGAFFAQPLPSGGDDNNGIAASSQGCIYIGGDFQPNPMILGNDTLSTTSHEYAFVAKLCYTAQALPVSNFSASQNLFCEGGGCINFYDSSSGNPTSWQWYFPGASPNISNAQNPTGICYSNSGTYPVTLIVTNASGTDTLTISPMITVSSGANPSIVTISNDTNFSSHASAYQWYRDGILIAGATDSFYVCSQAGTYSVRITDSLGCNALSNGVYNSCLTGIEAFEAGGMGLGVYPNPATDKLIIHNGQWTMDSQLSIYSTLGEKIFSEPLTQSQTVVDVSSFTNGVYLVQFRSNNQTINKNFIVIH